MPTYSTICRLDEFPPGTSRLVERDGLRVAVFHVDGRFYAIEDTCLHVGGPLHEGRVEGTTVSCPWHAWTFDLRDGSCPLVPSHRLACYPVRVKRGEVQLGFR